MVVAFQSSLSSTMSIDGARQTQEVLPAWLNGRVWAQPTCDSLSADHPFIVFQTR